MLFHRTGIVDVTGTAHAVVTRVDAGTWTVEPAGCEGDTPGLPAVVSSPTRGRTVYTDHGLFDMPFGLVLTRKP